MNNRLWIELRSRFGEAVKTHELPWRFEPTEDKNALDMLVGLHGTLTTEQPVYLLPMIEQQFLGGEWRIYFGLMWSRAPASGQHAIAAVKHLQASLQKAGFKSNESFLAWKWTPFHPRRREFLLSYARRPEKLLADIENNFGALLIQCRDDIDEANAALADAPHSLASSLDRLRDELID